MSKKIAFILTLLALVLTLLAFFVCSGQFEKYFLQSEKVEDTLKTKTKKTAKQKEEEELYENLPNVQSTDWNLILVNNDISFPTDQEVMLKNLANGCQIDERVYQPFFEMQEAAKAEGITLLAVSGYRSPEYQQQLFDEDVENYESSGLTHEEAEAKTREYVALPGYSEHHTGLAMDISSPEDMDKGLTPELSDTATGQWLIGNSVKYGFVIRYPKGKEEITKINYEPWHIRYVGKENSEYMIKHNLVLEEYVALLQKAGR